MQWTWGQNDGVALLSQLDSYSSYNDVWGYTDGNGREIAIVGTFNGTSFVETTDPFNPVELLFFVAQFVQLGRHADLSELCLYRDRRWRWCADR